MNKTNIRHISRAEAIKRWFKPCFIAFCLCLLSLILSFFVNLQA